MNATAAMMLIGTAMLVVADAAAPLVTATPIAMAAEARIDTRIEIAVEPRTETAGGPPVTGETLYRRLCASCHGVAAKGDGPAAAALYPRPTDLTRLRSGKPELMRQIDGRRRIRAHGTSQMPVWGEVLEQSLIGEPHRRRTALLKVDALADYVMRLRRTPPPAETAPPR